MIRVERVALQGEGVPAIRSSDRLAQSAINGNDSLHRLIETFELLFETPAALTRLRSLILDLAVRGMLTHLGSEFADKETHLFAVPHDWTWTTINHICTDSFYGPRFGKDEYVNHGGVPTIRTTDMTRHGDIILRDAPCVHVDPEKLKSYRVQRNDLLITRTGSIGMMAVFRADYPAIPSAYLIRFRFAPIASADFVYIFLKSPFGQRLLGLGTTTVAQPNVNATAIRAMPIPIPPITEQARIVAKVNELMRMLDHLEEKQAKARSTQIRFRSATFVALTSAHGRKEFDVARKRLVDNFEILFSGAESIRDIRAQILELAMRGRLSRSQADDESVDSLIDQIHPNPARGETQRKPIDLLARTQIPFQIPPTWRWRRWGDVTLHISSGWSPQCENHPRDDGSWGVLKVSAVSWFVFKPDENKALPNGLPPRPEFAARLGDFLMSRANTAELVGRSVIVEELPKQLLLSDKIIRCEFSNVVEKKFVNYFNRTESARAHYMANASGTSNSMKNISREVIMAMPVPLPPLAEQKRIVAKVDHLMKLCDELETKLQRSEDTASKLVDAVVATIVA